LVRPEGCDICENFTLFQDLVPSRVPIVFDFRGWAIRFRGSFQPIADTGQPAIEGVRCRTLRHPVI
jgi:hypothetical protein